MNVQIRTGVWFLALCLGVLAGCGSKEEKELRQTAVISFIIGTVDFRGEGGTDWHPARVGFRIVSGDAVRTGPDSRAELQTRGPYAVMRIGENTTFVLRHAEEKGLKTASARLVEGNLWGNVRSLGERERFAFETLLATATVRGTTFRMEARGDSATGIFVYEGSVEVQTQVEDRGIRKAATFNLGHGQSISISSTQPPQTGAVPAGDDWRNGWQPKKRHEIEDEELNLPVPMRIQEKPRPRHTAPTVSRVQMMQKDILDLAPGVFSEIQLKQEGDRYLTGAELFQEITSVQEIVIAVVARAWDALPSEKKEDLINRTFYTLKTSYPDITRFVTLTFSDKRKPLRLEYARYAQMAKGPPGEKK